MSDAPIGRFPHGLRAWGLDADLERTFLEIAADDQHLARVVRAERRLVLVVEGDGQEILRSVPQALLRSEDVPRSGDWVCVDPLGVVRHVLPRRTEFRRRAKGHRAVKQVVVANVDLALVLMGLDGDYNLRRLERYLMLVEESGARPVVLLTKAGLVNDHDELLRRVQQTSGLRDVFAIDVLAGIATGAVDDLVLPGQTAVLLGSSGVGKSTLVNYLVGHQLAKTGAVREHDDRGRHTTTRRELYLLPKGGVLIDSPGMRELQLWGEQSSLDAAFPEVVQLAEQCRFTDCQHQTEPGCQVLAAVAAGTLDAARLRSYRSLCGELRTTQKQREDRGRRSSRPPHG